ncbi:MAG: nucleoside hydrolase [Ruminobacter sp.]|nr:nucleoside hydrolase [Ruminobacter sp.]MBR1923798.1 nucleoside hydrolase [Ruminobacter sp.]
MVNSLLKKALSVVCAGCICMAASYSACAAVDSKAETPKKAPQKVILDTDMVEMFDDGVAMMMLYKNPDIDLMGVVTVTGNSWANDGMAYLVRQMEHIDIQSIPVMAIGEHYPIRTAGGFTKEGLKKELTTYGDVMAGYIGAQENKNPRTWQEAYKNHYKKNPPKVTVRNNGVDYLIEQAHRYPHQIKLVAIGPATNIAKAVEKDPSVAELFDEIIYMGGAFWVKGNAHEGSEFNIWLDPEAAKIAYRAPFDNQTFVALDITDKTIMDREKFEKIRSHIKNPELLRMFNESFFAKNFDKDEENKFKWFVWDVIAAAIVIDPSLITSTRIAYVDCITNPGAEYGKTVPYNKENAPEGTRPASIVMEIDYERFWNMLYKSLEEL